MSIFGDIWNKMTGSTTTAAAAAPAATPVDPNDFSPEPEAATGGDAAMSEVNVEQILSNLAAQKGEPSNWQTSIVDLLKVLDLNSSLANRKELAEELGVQAGADGSAEQNTALHRAVMEKLEANGGIVPDSLKV